jgi:hypothetical protein
MALQEEEVVDIPGLSGEEIITDLCEQIAAQLRRDCNLRPQDSYVNGYSAEVKLKVHCYGIDAADVEMTLTAKKTPPEKTDGPEKTVEIDAEVEVAHEPNLKDVRQRSGLPEPGVEQQRDEHGAPVDQAKEAPTQRRYGTRKAPVASGGARDFDE